RPIVDDDLLTQALRQFLGEQAAGRIGRAARGEGHDQSDGLGRIGVRREPARQASAQRESRERFQKMSTMHEVANYIVRTLTTPALRATPPRRGGEEKHLPPTHSPAAAPTHSPAAALTHSPAAALTHSPAAARPIPRLARGGVAAKPPG